MAILKVAQLGHPVLRTRAREVPAAELREPAFQRLLDDMFETMREYDGVGLAGPQVHVGLRVAVIGVDRNPRYPDAPAVEKLALINPVVTPLTDEGFAWWEGCLSIPGLRGRVVRPRRIKLDFLDRDGQPQSRELENFAATVVQHEVDHLDGLIFLDRMEDLTTLSFQREYERYWAAAGADDDEDEAETPAPAATGGDA